MFTSSLQLTTKQTVCMTVTNRFMHAWYSNRKVRPLTRLTSAPCCVLTQVPAVHSQAVNTEKEIARTWALTIDLSENHNSMQRPRPVC
jgi:hypothetical protein